MDAAKLLQKEIVYLMNERKRKVATLTYEEFNEYSEKIEQLFKNKETLYKEANYYLRLSNELFKQVVFPEGKVTS